ncbi:condensin subunit Smc [Coriobacterium glomerans PW2]|uniref:Chromosome partition protein Smc n=1 Tax=Coriobacterium glomerans (strain ATCC 49209 / DSM 20642 / JCM 10262 / PW2) TaxID=700015 RepID=F2N9Q6_CORGP|nr:chromosome segregation protein SMC [Coriobacterium glomerans]AEB07159.1 condensin subunit Smc [Coriobacterium glomerans PW2]
MYLKSLTLKGFKSFADRAHMVFEPGLAVIVGPNGSGKSNISDAILWVLGEQSARQLRGQAMEDVIFSGSSARQQVGVAEVTLVLDNADHVLPVEFEEVAITRRMYRSGESEYLINSSPCRLMDIQDVLHDSGLGKDTHSIISQGKLDAILQSRPEERRALIEEAAGIAKHKRRRERSQRKIASMDEHLKRAHDIRREIARQLKPLERQVDLARTYEELTARARELTQILAVDELRRLQSSWSELETRSKESAAELELARYRLSERERDLEKMQVTLEEKGLFVGDLGEQRRRMQDVVGRIGSDMRLLEEKGRNMVSRLSEMRGVLSGSEHQRRRITQELESATGSLDEARAALSLAEGDAAELEPAATDLRARRAELDERISRLRRDQRDSQAEADAASLELARVSEALSNADVKDALYASRLEQMGEAIESTRAALAASRARAAELDENLVAVRTRRDQATRSIELAQSVLSELRAQEREARDRLGEVRSELSSLEKLDDRLGDASPLAAKVARERKGSVVSRLADIIEAPPELEDLVESLLADDIDAIVLKDSAALADAGSFALEQTGVSGSAVLVARDVRAPDADHGAHGYRLVERLQVREGYGPVIAALLGHVHVVPTLADALDAPAAPGVVYVSADGARVRDGGVVGVGVAGSGGTSGTLERRRRIRELGRVEPDLAAGFEHAAAQVSDAERELQEARARESATSGELAGIEGERRSLIAEVGRLEQSLSALLADEAALRRQRETAAEQMRSAQPRVDEIERVRDEARASVGELEQRLAEAAEEFDRVRTEDAEAAAKLQDAKVRQAQAQERKRGLEMRLPELKRRLEGIDRRIDATTQASGALEVLRLRIDPLHERYDLLAACAMSWAARLRDQATLEEADSATLKKTIEDAKAQLASAKADLNRASETQSEIQVERGRLEIQVEHAIQAITADGTTVLEEALALPAPQDPPAQKRELNELVRKINGLGPVNQVAMEEYERLRSRADYIAAQLADLESARRALAKIISAIDRKMRRQFLTTFEQVDANFKRVFSMLFPGGQAYLEMTDPDHPAETGIEVIAQPRGKRISKMMLMSGGEKSLTALALLFAVYRTRTVPFYVLDEVEAALDDSNLSKLLGAIDVLRKSTQLLVVSHQRRTMEDADVLYGVSMQADGVSRVVNQKLDRVTGKVVKV